MPRFHFNVRNATSVVYDREGMELATLAEARDEAILEARFAMSERRGPLSKQNFEDRRNPIR